MKKIIIVFLIVILLVGCNGSSKDNIPTSNNILTDITTEYKPNKLLEYGSFINIQRCVNVEGNIEYLTNAFPFEYVGEEVRYYCETSFEYVYENGYMQDSIECLVLLFYDGQCIDFSINNSEYKNVHKMAASNTVIGEEKQYYVDFEFSFIPYGIGSGDTEKFYIMAVPLRPLHVENNTEKLSIAPITIPNIRGNVVSNELKVDDKIITTKEFGGKLITGDELEEYKKVLIGLTEYGIGGYDYFLLKKEDRLENIFLINEDKDVIDKTVTTIVMCDNEIIKGFSDTHLLTNNITENTAIVSDIDISSLEKGNHTIFTITIMEDKVNDTKNVYRSNFVDVEIK